MKKLFLIILVSISVSAMSFSDGNEPTSTPTIDGSQYEVPADVQAIIDNSCFGCHNTDSRSTKGKMKLNFDEMGNLKTSKLVGKLTKISKTVKNGKMPKKSFVEKYPDKALSEDDIKLITTWADELAAKYGGE